MTFSKTLLKYRDRMLIGLVHHTKSIYARWYKKHRQAWSHTKTSLLAFPLGSLGHHLGEFLQREQFELMPKLEDHDVMHVLFAFPTTIAGEVRMQFFLIGNRKRSLYTFGAAGLGLICAPEHLGAYWQAFQQGRSYRSIARWQFEYLLGEPLLDLQRFIARQPLTKQALTF